MRKGLSFFIQLWGGHLKSLDFSFTVWEAVLAALLFISPEKQHVSS